MSTGRIWLGPMAAVAMVCLLARADAVDRAAGRPAVLVHPVRGQYNGGVDIGFLAELNASGIEVDYTDRHEDFTWQRIKSYNCLVIFMCPGEEGTQQNRWILEPPYREEFTGLVRRFLDAGGGVFLMPYIRNVKFQSIKPLLDLFDAQVPIQTIEDPENEAFMTRMPSVRLAFTDQVLPSPVSEGVSQIWFPPRRHYNAADTNPLILGPGWQVVVRASKTAKSVPIDLAESGMAPPENVHQRYPGVPSPPIFAIRSFANGRLALSSTYPQFSFAQGTQWLYDREVLSRGLLGKPSHFGRLLSNTIRWLAEPSLDAGKLGGYVTDPDRLKPLNTRPIVKTRFEERYWGEKELEHHRPPRGDVHRGLIGVQTALSGAEGTVADFAGVARGCGLSFLVVMDDFARLTPAKFESLKTQCREVSDDDLLVLPGYQIDNNIGNHLFLFGLNLPWPRPEHLTGPNKTLLNQQSRDDEGNYLSQCRVLPWLLIEVHRFGNNIGFFDFSHSGRAPQMKDLRTYAMAAVYFYRDGKLIEDMTDDYLLTAHGGVPPAPVAVNLVRSPDELRREAEARCGLTYAQARSLETLHHDALRYMGQYDGPNVFPSAGPIIRAWPECFRVHTFAVEDFVTGRNLMRSRIHVTSDTGLREIAVYDGTELYRRFLPGGAGEFKRTLLLDGAVHRNLVLVATDVKGGKAVSYARESRKVGDHPEYCGDRVNVGRMILAHGPNRVPVVRIPLIYGGFTWDGGPKGQAALATMQNSQPEIHSKQGVEGDRLFNQTPIVDAGDEGVVVVRSIRNEVIDPRITQRSFSPWATYGPIQPSKLFDHTQQNVQWHHAPFDVHPVGHAGYGFGYGAIPTLFTTLVTFKKELDITRMQLFDCWQYPATLHPQAVISQGETITTLDLDQVKKAEVYVLDPDDWFGVYSRQPANAAFFTVRGVPMQLELGRRSRWLRLSAHPSQRHVKAGDKIKFGLATMTFPLDAGLDESDSLARRVRYLRDPTGLKVRGATRVGSPGVLEYDAEGPVATIEVPRPEWKTLLTLPIRVRGLNRRWSAGLWLKRGYVLGYYGKGENRYRPLGVDQETFIYVPIPVDLAEAHQIAAGHPVVADGAGRDVFIQVTQTSGGTGGPYRWHVSVNNPLDQPVTTTFTQTMDLPGLALGKRRVTLAPGEYRVLASSTQ